MEIFDQVRETQHHIARAFDSYDARQAQFKKKFDHDTRKHRQSICETTMTVSTSSSSSVAQSAQHQECTNDINHSADNTPAEISDSESTGYYVSKHAHIRDGLKIFYAPPNSTTGVICEQCFGYRSATFVHLLPPSWEEYLCETSGKHYYYHQISKKVRWEPPPDAHELSVIVFEKTNSVFTVCHCIPSKDQRMRLMKKFREHAHEIAHRESESWNRQLRDAFSSLTLSLVTKHTQ